MEHGGFLFGVGDASKRVPGRKGHRGAYKGGEPTRSFLKKGTGESDQSTVWNEKRKTCRHPRGKDGKGADYEVGAFCAVRFEEVREQGESLRCFLEAHPKAVEYSAALLPLVALPTGRPRDI